MVERTGEEEELDQVKETRKCIKGIDYEVKRS